MIERKAYQCEHCKGLRKKPKIYLSKYNALLHERSCFYNPKNKTCFTCIHNDKKYNGNFCDLHIKNEDEASVFVKEVETGEKWSKIGGHWETPSGRIQQSIIESIKINCDNWGK